MTLAWEEHIRPFMKRRLGVVAVAAALGLIGRAAVPRPAEASLGGLVEMLSAASGAQVSTDSISWEPSPGWWRETFIGRGVLFLGSTNPGAPKDLYRAFVRVTRGGEPIEVKSVRNITDTRAGDDVALERQGKNAVFATVAYGKIQSISVLDLDGIREADRSSSWFDRLLLAVSSLQQAGNLSGLGRTDIVLNTPSERARVELDPPILNVELDDQGSEFVYDLERRELRGAHGSQVFSARAAPEIHPPKPLVLWAVDTLRAEVGPGPIAWLEHRVFGLVDVLKRASFNLFQGRADTAVLREEALPAELAAGVPNASEWPPASIPSIWKGQSQGEGEWTPVVVPFLKRLTTAAEAPPYFYRTVIRPDAKRAYSEVLLIAMDTRQLELRMQAGYEDPKPTTGPPGGGRLPNDKAIQDRVVATFNGAFKTTHGEYGMMVERRVLVPPVAGGASVIVNDTGDIGLGNWPQTTSIPDDIVSFRQNLDPLVEDGKANPTARYIWGWQLEGTSALTERTALCVTDAGHLLFAWGREIDGPTLGRALRQARCSYGIHLDMNPKHCGFVFADVINAKKGDFKLELADKRMTIAPDKFVRWSAKDFFYLTLRETVPRDPSGTEWQADGGAQPAPAWLPSFFAGRQKLGQLEVTLASIEAGRIAWRLRAGSREPSPLGAPPKKLELSGEDAQGVVAALGLGHTTKNQLFGLAFDGTPSLPLSDSLATLVVSRSGGLSVHPPGKIPSLASDDEAVQLPLLADRGELTSRAREHGSLGVRGALCVSPAGRVVVAQAHHDSSDALANALLRVGCTRVVELDRGAHHPAFLHRAGTPTPPIAGYETTVLYALAEPGRTRTFRWRHEAAKPSHKPTSYDVELSDKKKKELGVVD